MADKRIEFFFCLNSPWVYFGQHRLEEIAKRHGARIVYKPVDLREMMIRLLGEEDAPERSEAHRKYGRAEMARWADLYGLSYNQKPRYYPVSQRRAACLTVAADRMGFDAGLLAFALPKAVWAQDRDINDRKTLVAIADECGLPGDILLAASEERAVREAFEDNTEEALRRDVFGIPSYVFGDLLLWGQDRLDFLDRALAKAG